ncbi:MAG: hypothetical protein ACLGGU_06275, partial [Gammaproteobacteria bacterium]
MHLHILGICGTLMGGIARLARETGAPTLAEGTQTLAGGFAQATWAATSRLVVVAGARADRVDTDTVPG